MAAEPGGGNGMEAIRAEVLIVGGGLVGLSLALALGRHGLSSVVIDREDPANASDAAFDGRASAIAHASAAMLKAIGVWRHVREAQPIWDIRVSDQDSLLFLHYDHRELGDEPFGEMVENRVLRQALYAAVAETPQVRLLAPTTLRRLTRGAPGVEGELADGRTVRASLAVGADGKGSRLREEAGIRTTSWTYPQVGIVCTVAHERPHLGIAQERFLAAGPFAILPLTGNRSSLVWTERADLAPAILELDGTAFHAELSRRFGDYLGRTEAIGPRWSYPLALHHAESYIAPRLALVGDAAHGIHPIAGQGLNLGLRDVAALAELLVEGRRLGLESGNFELLERYQRWRRFDTVLLAGVTDVLNRLFSNDIPPVKLARDIGLAAVNRIGPLKRFFMQHARGTVGELPKLLRGESI